MLKIGLAQISPVWLNKTKTIEKIIEQINIAADKGCGLVVFGEALLPGYSFWPEITGGAEFNSPVQKELFSYYVSQAVDIEAGDLISICETAQKKNIAVYLGMIEKSKNRGTSLYCSLVYICAAGEIGSVHRKLMPTYEERLVWAIGDGHGLRVHKLGAFTVGGLNCWENWIPMARAALYGQGEDLHIAVWPGGLHNTEDITRFIAKESRSFVVSVSGLMRREDIPAEVPYLEKIQSAANELMANGGSCVAGPDGEWLLKPVLEQEGLFTVEIDHARVREERQNFDPAGHYSRPDVLKLTVNRTRQTTVDFED